MQDKKIQPRTPMSATQRRLLYRYDQVVAEEIAEEVGTFFWLALAGVLGYVLLAAGCAIVLI
jgi:CubicO group peptidase (beta-lactamase class C family)